MIKLTDILEEIKTNINEISDSKYAYYWLDYKDKNNEDKTYSTSGYLKIADYIDDNEISKYKLYGRKFNNKTHSNEWEFIESK